jgi:hypothetical protein
MRAGSTATDVYPSTVARGSTPCLFAADSDSTRIAAAPSVIAEALPAVIVPP